MHAVTYELIKEVKQGKARGPSGASAYASRNL